MKDEIQRKFIYCSKEWFYDRSKEAGFALPVLARIWAIRHNTPRPIQDLECLNSDYSRQLISDACKYGEEHYLPTPHEVRNLVWEINYALSFSYTGSIKLPGLWARLESQVIKTTLLDLCLETAWKIDPGFCRYWEGFSRIYDTLEETRTELGKEPGLAATAASGLAKYYLNEAGLQKSSTFLEELVGWYNGSHCINFIVGVINTHCPEEN